MVGTITSQRAKMERVREAVSCFCREKLGDPLAIIEFIPLEVLDLFEVVVISPKFKPMPYTERLITISEFLENDSQLAREDLNSISRILTEAE